MKIVHISDTHGAHSEIGKLPEGDILIHSGDGTKAGHPKQVILLNEYFRSIAHKYEEIIYIPGNHDFLAQTDEAQFRLLLSSATILIDQEFTFGGVKIYGSPWTPTFFDWAFMGNEEFLRKKWDLIPKDTRVLVTHGPPYMILDKTTRHAHVGSVTLRTKVLEIKPELHLFGHIHEANGLLQLEGTTFSNGSNLDDWYQPESEPRVLEIKD